MNKLQKHVQYNCHISDASHAGNYTLCIYLLKMREFYRWEHALGFNDHINNEEIGNWLTARESLWESLERSPFKQLQIANRDYDPFDIEGVNQALEDQSLIYSAGYILRGKPHFFLADIIETQDHKNYRIIISGKEHARELSAPPALSQGKTIFIRSESLRRTVWEKVEESLWNKSGSPLSRAINCYDFKNKLEDSLTQLCNSEIKTLVAHEIGEILAGEQIGEDWNKMISAVSHPSVELMLRSIRDNLADCLSTLPDILENFDAARLHFFIANIGNMRKALFPALRVAYDNWIESESLDHFEQLANQGRVHWLDVAENLLMIYRKEGRIAPEKYQAYIESRTL